MKKASCLFQNTKSEKCDFHFSPKINDLGVVDFAGTSIFRYQASKFFEFQQPASAGWNSLARLSSARICGAGPQSLRDKSSSCTFDLYLDSYLLPYCLENPGGQFAQLFTIDPVKTQKSAIHPIKRDFSRYNLATSPPLPGSHDKRKIKITSAIPGNTHSHAKSGTGGGYPQSGPTGARAQSRTQGIRGQALALVVDFHLATRRCGHLELV
ncbi:hypothetical protein [Microbulbifer sp. TYP-18]|uniref:hypothetical protein n=1 Tax=Microbulbifer sp. TYP-18 TaxID=3230024 RepID=UPI0034C6BBFF